MVYFRTIFSTPSEIKYLKLNLRECFDYVDKFIIVEFNRTHVGKERELVFEKYLDQFSAEERKKLLYIGADISVEAEYTESDSKIAHRNETIMRGYFVKEISLRDEDIVFATDADEIIFRQHYEPIIKKIESMRWPFRKSLVLPMHQFYYKHNYLWENLISKAAVACRASAFRKYPSDWRSKGKLYPEIAGCHFSWCITTDEMITKLGMYAHHKDYGHLAKKEVLEDAVKNKEYPFEPNRPFQIRVLDMHKDTDYYPQSLYTMFDEFKPLIGT